MLFDAADPSCSYRSRWSRNHALQEADIVCAPPTDNKKAELRKGFFPFGNSAIFFVKRPVAFRPLFTKGLALSAIY